MSGGTFALLQKKRMKDSQLKELRATFAKYDKNGDGGLTEEEWYEVMRDSGSDISREGMSSLFASRDRDHDGKLTFEEFVGQETKNERAFKAMDANGDGFVTRAEFKKACKALKPEQIEAAITKFDKAGNGKLDYLEFCGMMNAGKNRKESEAGGSGPGSKSDTPQMPRRDPKSKASTSSPQSGTVLPPIMGSDSNSKAE